MEAFLAMNAGCRSGIHTTRKRILLKTSLAVQALEVVLGASRGLELGTYGNSFHHEFSHNSTVIAGLLGSCSHFAKQEFVKDKFTIALVLLR